MTLPEQATHDTRELRMAVRRILKPSSNPKCRGAKVRHLMESVVTIRHKLIGHIDRRGEAWKEMSILTPEWHSVGGIGLRSALGLSVVAPIRRMVNRSSCVHIEGLDPTDLERLSDKERHLAPSLAMR